METQLYVILVMLDIGGMEQIVLYALQYQDVLLAQVLVYVQHVQLLRYLKSED